MAALISQITGESKAFPNNRRARTLKLQTALTLSDPGGRVPPKTRNTGGTTMRTALYSTVAIVVAFSPLQAGAAEVSEAGAKQIFEKLTYYLPKDIVDTGFLKVKPGTQRYELSVDIAPFLKNLKPS
jgi:hypothetical protein